MSLARRRSARAGARRALWSFLVACGALMFAGCVNGYEPGPPGNAADIIGSYKLISFNGKPLPVAVNWDGIPATLQGDTLDFGDSGQWQDVSFLVLQHETTPQSRVSVGTATQMSGDSVNLGSELGQGTILNDTLRLRASAGYVFGNGSLLVFARF